MRTLAVIPARYASSRFPGKPLVDIGGKTMIRRVYEQVSKARLVDEVIVATDDDRISKHVLHFGGRALMTRDDHRSGTDRCAEVAARFKDVDFVINIQGDEPFIAPEQVDEVVRPLKETGSKIATLARPIHDREALFNPNVVKVVLAGTGQALYFSRSPIPYQRNVEKEKWHEQGGYYKHLGLYGFQHSVLLELTQLPPSRYEQAESLEQLRWLEAGYSIYVGITERETLGIDTPEDLERAKEWL